MKLTVVIVNYNVEHFLEQCLLSVEIAMKAVSCEVFVVDNQSVDGSCAMVRERFPWVKLIANTDNVGFSRANNQAMRIAAGEYVLLLNPDTVVEEDTFEKVVEFMDRHPDAGGLGVRMVDGKGVFLPESKRGLPTPWVSFCKISGIYRLFPRSRRFNHYYFGFVNEHEEAEIEILSGAFMLMRKAALDKVGLLDEAFFMYGEDIDLSWRIILGGFKNYYFPATTIIHYKGESTKKGSLNYVFVFYNAMIIFAKKHFSEKNAKAFSQLINLAIYARAALAVAQRFVQRMWLPVLDALLLFAGLWLLKTYYADLQNKIFEADLVQIAFGVFAAIWVSSVHLSGGYDKPSSPKQLLRGAAIGSLIIVLGYSLLPESLRFSRALVLLGSLFALLYFALSRLGLSLVAPKVFTWRGRKSKRIAIVGDSAEFLRINNLLTQTHTVNPYLIGVGVTKQVGTQVGVYNQLEEVIRVHKIEVVVFSGKDLSAGQIIQMMNSSGQTGVDFKIAPPDTLYMIGSNSIDTAGDLFMLETNSIHKPLNKRKKRIFDVTLGLLLLLSSPISVFFVNNKSGFFTSIFRVLTARMSWVGYAELAVGKSSLPALRKGVVTPLTGMPEIAYTQETADKLNLIYARDYKLRNDLLWVFRHFKLLGGK
ncbi:MAG: glycosyltransferase [Cryomorphaceae bacterium]|nr:glycosyltransferase [Cryomorphaceae bacterium]